MADLMDFRSFSIQACKAKTQGVQNTHSTLQHKISLKLRTETAWDSSSGNETFGGFLQEIGIAA